MTIKTTAIAFAATIMASAAAQAGMISFAEVDKDANGYVSFEEVKSVKADMDLESFKKADTDNDGVLNDSEFGALLK